MFSMWIEVHHQSLKLAHLPPGNRRTVQCAVPFQYRELWDAITTRWGLKSSCCIPQYRAVLISSIMDRVLWQVQKVQKSSQWRQWWVNHQGHLGATVEVSEQTPTCARYINLTQCRVKRHTSTRVPSIKPTSKGGEGVEPTSKVGGKASKRERVYKQILLHPHPPQHLEYQMVDNGGQKPTTNLPDGRSKQNQHL